ncbi:MAG TPA: MerR family transcriptional regulator [Stellaceae bacterium]|nr:MerR family transcriptional regulator [Stellaceae bacterium]
MPSHVVERQEPLTRGELADRIGCNIETIRYYEQAGLLPPPPRSQGGHRLYGQELIKRLNFVRRSRDLGFTLEEIRGLLRLVDGRKYTCAQIEALARDHVQEIGRKISDLRKLKNVLDSMASQCSRGKVPACPIIDALFDARLSPALRPRRQSLPGARSAKSVLAKSNSGRR